MGKHGNPSVAANGKLSRVGQQLATSSRRERIGGNSGNGAEVQS